ncbi:transcription factor MYC2 [Dendrobium catenatum]|uniref:Transcription factor n=1 Tax=Dendrobium catenatum TaxID=906689 RepID=A0A2I0WI68_9ASPA|nr:transcription factor MYC2 [Dendrobium catenatum]PKU75351.1 Transcription factor bHLH14 [Dendrobium catenatum]
MDELISPSSSCSPPQHPPPPPFFSAHPIPVNSPEAQPPPPPSALQYRIQCLLHSRPEWWTYAIFWRTSSDLTVLCFGDGHFRGTRDDDRKRAAAAVTAVGDVANDSDDAEWFYVVSLTRWFSVGAATAPARAYASLAPIWLAGAHALQTCGCERSSEAQLHGIETLVFIPAAGGVLELGSGDLVGENWALVQQAKSLLFAPDDADPVYSVVNRAQVGNLAGGSSSVDSEHSDSEGPGLMVERRRPKKRGRKPGSVRESPVNHVEAERQRREKLNHRFYALRSVVPNVSRMDKASLLADAVSYIKDLRAKVEELEAEAKRGRKEVAVEKGGSPTSTISGGPATVEVEVKLLCSDAMIRVQSENLSHPPARLMAALRDLDLLVHHATVSGLKEMVIQDVVVQVPDALQGEDNLRCALLARLEKN